MFKKKNSHETICNDDINLRDLDIQVNQIFNLIKDSDEVLEIVLFALGFKNFDELKEALFRGTNSKILLEFVPIDKRLIKLEESNDELIKKNDQLKHELELQSKEMVALKETVQNTVQLLNDLALNNTEEPLLKKRTKTEQKFAPCEPIKVTQNIPVGMKSILEATTQNNLKTISEEKPDYSKINGDFFYKNKPSFNATDIPSQGNNQNETWGPEQKKVPGSIKKNNMMEFDCNDREEQATNLRGNPSGQDFNR